MSRGARFGNGWQTPAGSEKSVLLTYRAHAHAHAIFISTTTKPLPDLAANTDYVTLTLTDSYLQNCWATLVGPIGSRIDSITCRGTLWAGCILHVVGLRFLWRNAGWLRLEAAVVVLHKVGGGVIFNFTYLIN